MRRSLSGLPALSLWNPHAGLMAIGAKSVETRGQRFAITGPLAIASTVAVPAGHRMWARNLCYTNPTKRAIAQAGWSNIDNMPRGCVVALVWVVSEIIIGPLIREAVRRDFGDDEMEFGFYEDGRVAMVTDPARRLRLPDPVHVTGRQGKFFLDAPTRAKIRAQLAIDPIFVTYYRDAFDRADAADLPTTPDSPTPTART